MKSKKYVVTGGAGFIGSHVVDALIERGDDVVVLDDLSTGKLENLNTKAKFHKVDISGSIRDIISFFIGAKAVFHLAAWARVPRSIEDPVGTNRVNVGSTLNVLQICRQLVIPKLIYSSSSSVYGDQDTFLMDETMTNLKPKSPYGLQKLIGERYCEMFSELFNMKIVALRYFNVYGPRQLTEGAYALVIGKFIEAKSKGKKLTVYGDGKQTRAYTFVGDVVNANLLAMEKDIGGYQAFNIGTGQETSVNEIAELIGGRIEHITPNPRGAFEERRKAAAYSKAQKLLGWNPKTSILQGINTVL